MTAKTGTDIELAAELIAAGKLVAFATETVYGLGADATNSAAVAQVFAVKHRPTFDPLIVHFDSVEHVRMTFRSFPEQANQLAERFWPGPLSIVLPRAECGFSDLVSAGLSTVAVRVPSHRMARDLIAKAGRPVAAPSANLFGRISPTTASHVVDQLGEKIDYILDGGPCTVGVESTVIRVSELSVELLRHGGITIEQLTSACRCDVIDVPKETDTNTRESRNTPMPSPGMTEQHYAPRTPLTLVDSIPERIPEGQVGLIALQPPDDSGAFSQVETLSNSGDPREAATNLFAALRRLDAATLDRIVAVRLPDEGLGRAINDRLNRAQHH